MRGAADPGAPERVITVFGSSRVAPEHPAYQAAWRLGRLIAERGWVLCNGGYNGTMEAAAQGAKEAGGKTIGVTVSIYREMAPNPWVDERIVTPSLFARLEHLVTLGHAYVVLHGGIGTLLELAMVWNAVQATTPRKPVLVVGAEWAELVEAMRRIMPMHPWESASLDLVPSVEGAMARLDEYFGDQDASLSPRRR